MTTIQESQPKPKKNKYALRASFFFKDLYGEPLTLTKGQQQIYKAIYDPDIKRAVIRSITQYGKSEITSAAIVDMAVSREEKILIVAPSMKQSGIIMGKVIDHFFDHPYLTKMIEYYGKLEQLQQERSKNRITTRNGSEIKILTAEATSVSKEAKNLMGFGATVVIVDESSLIPDSLFSKILRMVGGVKGGKLIQLGNPFYKNHFYKAFYQERYKKITIDWRQALAEGRITQEFLDEAKENMPPKEWGIFYECEFPDEGADDSVLPMDWIMKAVNQSNCEGEYIQAGLDVARFGNDSSVSIIRNGGLIISLEKTSKMDTMAVTGWASRLYDTFNPEQILVDVIGIGSGVYDRLTELGYPTNEINVGEAAKKEETKNLFFNLRAEMFWGLREWFKPDKDGNSKISIPNDPELIKELSEIRYTYSSEKKIKIESKDKMKERLGRSPDKADALAMAFYNLTDSNPGLIIV